MRLIYARGDFCAIPCQQQMRSLTWNKEKHVSIYYFITRKLWPVYKLAQRVGFYCTAAGLCCNILCSWNLCGGAVVLLGVKCVEKVKRRGWIVGNGVCKWWRRLDDVQGLYVLPKCCFCCWLLCTWEKGGKNRILNLKPSLIQKAVFSDRPNFKNIFWTIDTLFVT